MHRGKVQFLFPFGRGFLTALVALVIAGCGGPTTQTSNRSESPAPTVTSQGYLRFADADPHPWDRKPPWSYPIHGLDVSRFQGEIDWRKVRASGIEFAFLKATEGGDLLDPSFETNWRQARRSGVRRGAYHFYYFCRPAEDQARWFIRNVPRDGAALPPVLDLEWNPFSPTCTFRPEPAVVRSEARRFLDILERHYGKRPIIYTTPEFYEQTGIGRLRGTQFWLRSVAAHPSTIYPGQAWSFWQYTGTGLVPGVAGEVDINVFGGSQAAWSSWP